MVTLKRLLSGFLFSGTLAFAGVPEFGKMTTIEVDGKPLDTKGGTFIPRNS